MNEPFVGPSGRYLRSALERTFSEWTAMAGEGIAGVCRFNNVVRTHPPNNNNPSEVAVECCRPSVIQDIEATQPLLILAVGGVPLNWLLLPVHAARLPYKITEWRGRFFPVQIGAHQCWAAATYHPSYVQRQSRTEYHTDVLDVFMRDLAACREFLLHAEVPRIWSSSAVREKIDQFVLISGDVGDLDRFDALIEHFGSVGRFAFDIETASSENSNERKLRPYGRNARLLSISLSDGERTACVALDHQGAKWSEHEREYVGKRLKHLFQDTPGIKKIAHNLAFELEWMVQKLGLARIHGCNWEDTLAQAYIIDSRTGVLSLDSLTRIWFGQGVKQYEPVDILNLDVEPVDRVLRYNGVDSFFTFFLHERQSAYLRELRLDGVAVEQIRRIPSFVRAQILGIPISQKEVAKYRESLTQQRDQVVADLQTIDAVREFSDRFGTFNPGSDSDVRKLLRDVLRRTEGYRGEGSYSTDESVLKQIDLPVTDLILKYRQFAKLRSTYIEPLVADNKKFVWPDGKVHPVYKLAFVATRRTSSEFPNIQNQPKRRDKYIRSCFVAPEGYLMVPVDYGQIEARVIAMASKDDYLVEALWNRYDIHQEWAVKMASLRPELLDAMDGSTEQEKMAGLRQEAKNKLVFPAFYGAQAYSIAQSLGLPQTLVQELLGEFWKTFSGVRQWQLELDKFYRKYGYVELLTGFRRYAPLEGNKIINTPIQGTASDIVVDAMNRCSAYSEQVGDAQLQPRMNIHDDLTFFIKEEELEDRIADIASIMLTPTFDFINVPLAVEITVGPDWYQQQEVAKLFSDEWFQ